jgi:hypothetical protein
MWNETRQELENRLDELARQYAESRRPSIKREMEKVSRLLAKLKELGGNRPTSRA